VVRTLLAEGVETRLGGILYLINMMVQLDLPDCFEEEWGLASQVGPWGLLELLGRALLVSTGQAFTPDAIWPALAELVGRDPAELPGAGFRGANRFRLPPAWVAPETNRSFAWAAADGQLYLWTGTGYLLVNCPRTPAPAELQARQALQPYLAPGAGPADLLRQSPAAAPRANLKGPLLAGLNASLGRGLACLLPYLRLRLQGALAGTEEAVRQLLLVSGQLYVTASHVDLVIPLADISLPARLTGLDRDPGWLAGWGRVVKFHFE
jgi:hypothetical protein